MRWMIWPRQYGKTYQVTKWIVEDLENRVILTSNESLARLRRRELEEEFASLNLPSLILAEYRKLLKTHIVSFRSWQKMRGVFPPTIEIAIDGIDDIAEQLFGGNVQIITGAGHNEKPDKEQAGKAAAFHQKWAEIDPESAQYT